MPQIEFRNLTLAYARHPAIHHLNATVASGSLTAIVGPNGSGKSTLLKAIMGQLRPVEGELRRRGFGPRDIGYLPQQANMERDFPISVGDFLLSGLWRELGAFAAPDRAQRARLQCALAQVGLQGFSRRQLGTLSGGQLQRLLFARLLLQDRPVVLLDEPFNAIDEKTAHDLLQLIALWHGEARTILVVTHDLDQVRQHFPRTLLLARELLAHGPTAAVLEPGNLLRARRLCEAFDDKARPCRRESEAA
ncbi:MAG TPA: ABC transporter ATP-binding protein [Hyphomicrobiales bacterium]|nr:ABC transporter ATP-binding protein [Hyphomicrobiales bacterium]